MTVSATYSVWCDGQEIMDLAEAPETCPVWLGEEPSQKDALQHVKELGWTRVIHDGKKRDLCPVCNPLYRHQKTMEDIL